MLQKMRMKLKEKKGFTLMEMLIVVAIIAILLAILIPAFGGALNDARLRADQANARAYYADQMAKLMTDEKYVVVDFNDTILQVNNARVTHTGTTAADFAVTYDPGTPADAGDDTVFSGSNLTEAPTP